MRKGHGVAPFHSSPEQLAYRREETVRLRRAGFSVAQIAAAMGISVSLTSNDLTAMGMPSTRVRGKPEGPPEVDWRHPPLRPLQAPVDRVTLTVRHFLAEMRAVRYESAHASDVLDARRRDDEGWLREWRQLSAELLALAETLSRQHEPGADLRAAISGWGAETNGRAGVSR